MNMDIQLSLTVPSPDLVLPKWSPQLSTILGIIDIGMLNRVNIQLEGTTS